MKKNKAMYEAHVHRRLLVRQRLFFGIVSILAFLSIRAVAQHAVNGWLALSGFFLSTFIGLLFSRIFKIHWDSEEEKVVSKLDAFGIALLVLYIGLDFARNSLFRHWLTGEALSAFGLIFLTGLLLGRFLGITKRIRSILVREKKIK